MPFILEQATETHEILVKLEEINSPESANDLASKDIFLEAKYAQNGMASSEALSDHEYLNLRVFDQDDVNKGLITNVVEHPHQMLVEIKNDTHSFMAPIHEDLIIALDLEAKTIKLEISEGLDSVNS